MNANSLIVKFPTSKWIFQGDGDAGVNAPVSQVSSLATDRNGNILFADPGNHVVERLNTDGSITVLAGNGVEGFSGDNGPALSASLNRPSEAVMDSRGNLYILDAYNYRIRRVTPSGTISTIAGTGFDFDFGIGVQAITASVSRYTRLAVDAANNLYLSGPQSCQVRRITTDGNISAFAGTGTCGHAGDGLPALQADIDQQFGGISFDSAGNLYFTESARSYVRKIGKDGKVSTIAGNGITDVPVDGPALSTPISFPHSVVVDSAGNVFYSEVNNKVIRKVTPGGTVSTIAGIGGGFGGDGGPPAQAQFLFPEGLAFDGFGNLHVADSGNFRVRRIQAGIINTVAGNAQFRSVPDGTPASQSYLYGPASLAFDLSGNLLISELAFHKVAQVLANDASFRISAGTGTQGRGGESGPANQALLGDPQQIATDAQGNLFIADSYADVVYEVTADGKLSKVAGAQAFVHSYGGDNGPALGASFNGLYGIVVDSSGNIFLSETRNNRVRRFTVGGNITTYAGTGTPGYSGDNVPASAAQLSGPKGLAIDAAGNLLICDAGNNRVRLVTPAGVISTIAGDGNPTTSGDGGPASQASVNGPSAIAVDNLGGTYLITSGGRRLRLIDPAGNITTLAGDGITYRDQGDGGPASAAFLDAEGLAVDPFGNVFLTSQTNDSIRAILNFEPLLFLAQDSFSSFPYQDVALRADSGGAPTDSHSFSVDGDFPGVLFNATSDQPWIKLSKTQGVVPSTITFTADPSNPSKLTRGLHIGHIALTRVGGPVPFAGVTVILNVTNALPPNLLVQPPTLSMSTAKGAASQAQTIHILNTTSGTLNYQISSTGFPAGSLVLSKSSGSVTAGTPVDVTASINPANLTPGTYTANLAISNTSASPPQIKNVPFAISVASKPQRLALSQRGLLFTAVQGGGVTPPQSFAVLNAGGGSFDWTATPSTLDGGSAWLSIAPAAGTSTAGSSRSITVTADPRSLGSPGVYYGLVTVQAPNAADAPQAVEVVLNLLGPDKSPGPVVSRSGLLFVSPAGASSPSSQTLTITNLNATPLAITPSANTLENIPWLSVGPDSALQQIVAGGNLRLTVAAKVDGLPPGVHRGTILLQFPSPLPNLEVDVRLVVTPAVSGGSSADLNDSGPAASCTPTQLVPVLTSFFDNFTTPAAWPIALEATVLDDCGVALAAGRVVASFSNGDPPLSLFSLNDGRWQGTWFGGNINPTKLTITLTGDSAAPALHGAQDYNGLLQKNDSVPAITPGAPVSSVGNVVQTTVGPGGIVSIQGSSFAAKPASAPQTPLSYTLAGNAVVLAGVNLPLFYTSDGVINAVIPYDLPSGQYQLVVMRGQRFSGPEPVVVGAALPGILQVTTAASSQIVQTLWTQILTGQAINQGSIPPRNPVRAGDTLTIYCTGLGAVSPAMLDPAQAAPSPGPRAQNTPTLTIGATNITVSSAALVPGYVGIYAVQATIPSGLNTGDNIPLTISVLGQTSSPVPVSVR